MTVVIPCFDEPEPCKALKNLAECHPIKENIEIIVVVNCGENAENDVKRRCTQNYRDVCEFAHQFSRPDFVVSPRFLPDMPQKHAGVGLARKTGMDEAARRSPDKSVIICFDADTQCSHNYFTAIEEYLRQNPKIEAGSIRFEHPIDNNQYPKHILEGIVKYELHLRYYIQALRYAQLPFAYHTVGSAMFCTTSIYKKSGGMNKRKAGEDFYFLQKLIPYAQFGEINTCKVIPSPRISSRVPFGTGRAMMKYAEGEDILTYSLEAFDGLAKFVEKIPSLYKANNIKQKEMLINLPESLTDYLESIKYLEAISEINENCADFHSFKQRFFTWFNAFRTLKYLNQVHSDIFQKKPVAKEAAKLLQRENQNNNLIEDPKNLLIQYRNYQLRIKN